MLDYDQGHHLVHTDSGSLTDPGCSYPSCFTSEARGKSGAESNSKYEVEQGSNCESWVEWRSDSKVGWSSDWWGWEMGCPLTSSELRVEWGSNLRVEWRSEMRVEWSSELKGRAEQSSNLEVEWSSKMQKCKMGHPLTIIRYIFSKYFCSQTRITGLSPYL